MIYLTICDDTGTREIRVSAKNMKELIDEKLPLWLPRLEKELPVLKKTERFQRSPTREERNERRSGWYYDCDGTPNGI